jgi:hypothetical protein
MRAQREWRSQKNRPPLGQTPLPILDSLRPASSNELKGNTLAWILGVASSSVIRQPAGEAGHVSGPQIHGNRELPCCHTALATAPPELMLKWRQLAQALGTVNPKRKRRGQACSVK